MRFTPSRLGPRINLTLLLFMLLLGGAVATLVFFGFRQTQDNATKQSQQGLESQARDTLLYNAQVQAYVGQAQFAASGAAGQDAASYMIDLKKRGGSVPWDSSKLARAADGRLYDANPLRVSDVVVPAGTAPADAERDLADSAALDAVFETLLDSSARGREANFGAVAMSYISANGVTRSYPPAGLGGPPLLPARDPKLMQELGPDTNPARKTMWSSPAAVPGGLGTVITASTPVYEDNTFRGVVTVDLSLQRLIDQINLVKPTPSGFAFYMDDTGSIFHTAAYDTVTAAMNDPTNEAFARTLASMRRRDVGVERVTLGGRAMFVAYAPVGDVGGVFALAAPLDELTEQAGAVHSSIRDQGNRTLLFVLAALGVFFLAALTGAAWLNGRLVLQPIGALVRGTHSVAAGDLDTRIPVSTRDEFGTLAESFNSMTQQIANRRDELRAEVAERERMAEALRRSEELYRTLARNFPNGVVTIFDQDLRCTLADGAGLAAAGVTKDVLEGRLLEEIFPPRLRAELGPRFRAALRGERSSFEVVLQRRTYHVFSLPLLDERGAILGGMAMTQDITERKQAEVALRNERDLNDAIVGSAGALVCLLDREGRFVRFNRACEDATGYAAAEVLGKPFWDVVIPPEQAGALQDVFARLIAGPFPHHNENDWQAKDGRRRLISWTNNALYDEDGSVAYFVCTGIDRTEERQAEALLREREEQYRSVFESTTDGLIISNEAAEIIEVNPAMCAMHGYTRAEFLALPPRAFIDPAYHPKRDEYVRGIQEHGEYRARSRNVRKDGSTFPVEVYGTSFMYRGSPHLLGVVRDITAQVETEEELERRVHDRTHELATLLDVTKNVASTLELEPLLHVVLAQVKEVVAFELGSFHLREGDELIVGAVDTPDARDVAALSGARVRIIEGDPLWETMSRGEPVIIDDILVDTPMERSRRAAIRGRIGAIATPVRSWLGVPLSSKGRIIGMLALFSPQPAFFSERDARLAGAIASQAAFAVENARLFTEEEQRTRELRTLLDSSRTVASTIELRPLLHLVLGQVKEIVPYDDAAFLLRDGDDLRVVAVDTVIETDATALTGARLPGAAQWDRLVRGEPMLVADVLGDTEEAIDVRTINAAFMPELATQYRSWLGVPVRAKERVVGMLVITAARPGAFSEHDAELALTMANQAAAAIENAHLFEQEAARTRELQTLLDASRSVASTIELEPLLQVILDEVKKVAPYDRASLMLREGDDFVTTVLDMPDAREVREHGRFRFSVAGDPPLWLRLRDGDPVIIGDTRGDSPEAADYRAAVGRRLDTSFALNRSWLGVPLRLQDRVIAVLALAKEQSGFYGEREAQLASAIARQAAFAVDNARLFERAERRTRELAALLDVSRHVSSTLELRPLAHRILEETAAVVGFDRSTFVLADGEGLEVVAVHAADGAPDDSLTEQIGERYPVGGPPLVWDPLLRGEPVIVEDTHADTPLAGDYRRAVGPRHVSRSQGRSWMAVPLMLQGRLNGIMFMTKRTVGFFGRHDAELASAIAVHAAIGVENARQYERAERRTQELTALLDVSRSIASTLDLKTLLRDLLERVAGVVEYERSAFMLLEDDVMRIVEVRTTGDTAGEYVSRQVGIVFRPEDAGMLWDVVRAGRPLIIDDVLGDSEPAVAYRTMVGERMRERMGVRAWLGVPLEAKGRVVGMMTIAHSRPGAFSPRDAEIAGAIASQAAVGVDNAQLFERLERQARELSTLLDVARHVGSTLEVRPLARSILEETARVVGHDRAAFMLVEGDETRIVAVRSVSRERDGALVSDIDVAPSAVPPELWEPLRAGRHVIIDDVTADTPLAGAFRAAAGDGYLDDVPIRSWMAVPVLSQGRLNGVIMLAKEAAGAFTARDADLATAIASQASVGVENARLFEQTEQRRRELAALLDVARHVGSTLDFGRLASLVLEEAAHVVDFDRAAFMLIEDGEAVVRQVYAAHGGLDESLRVQIGQRFPFDEAPPLWDPLRRGEPVAIGDVRDGSPLALAYQELRRDTDPKVNPVRSWMAVPLMTQGRMIGILGMTKLHPHFFTQAHIDLASALASQAAAGVENARLFEQAEQRTRELSTVLHVSHAVASTLQLRELAQLILEELREAIEYTGASLIVREDETLVITESRGPRSEEAAIGMRFPIDLPGGWWQRLSAGTPISIDNVRDESPDAQTYRALLGGAIELQPFSYVRSWLAVPLVAQDRVAGVLTMSRDTPGYFNDEHARLALAIADQAALAIENARLYERVQTTAALEERQRLARELHDSVSQALYGIGLGARTAKAMLERDATRAKEPIEYVLSLAEAGLTEMRALIFELRPESLQTEGLVAALEKQVSATRARYGIEVDADLGEEPEASLDAKEAVYRIAQEALHNTVKHAHARRVELTLTAADGVMRLDVRDDGQGFDADGDFPGHLGLQSMRERVARVRGTLDIQSAPGAGTRIRALIPAG